MSTITSKYAQINVNNKLIELFEHAPRANGLTTTLEDVTIEIENGVLTVIGKKWTWGFLFGKKFVEDMNDKPIEIFTRLGYKTIGDFFKGIKKPYVKMGWFLCEKKEDYKAIMAQWHISI